MTEPKFDPRIHHRKSIRLQGFDYSRAGAYFVTIVAHGRECLFGEIVDGEMKMNRFGEILNHAWFDLPRHYRHVSLGAFVIMPNHVHGIIVLNEDDSVTGRGGSVAGRTALPANSETCPYVPLKRHPLSEIVRAFKSFSAKRINVLRRTQGIPVWQRNYYEHIIRNDREMERIWHYIESNPSMWTEDDENPLRRR